MESFLKNNNRKCVSVYQFGFFVSIILFTTSAYAINYVSSPIVVPSDTVIDGNNETFQAQNWQGTCNSIYHLDSVHNVVIENMIIDANDSDPNNIISGIGFQGKCSNITIRNCVIKNCAVGTGCGTAPSNNVEQLHIENCIIEKCNWGISFLKPVSYMYISDSTITKCNTGFQLDAKEGGFGDINHVFLNNVKIDEVGHAYPIHWGGVQYFKLNNVSVVGRNLSWDEGGTADNIALYGCQDGVVSNCHSEGGGDLGFAANYNDKHPADPKRILFIGNTALNNATAGFRISGDQATDNILVNNFASGNKWGIMMRGGTQNIISQNICSDNNDIGIWIVEDAYDTIVTENILYGNKTNLVDDSDSTELAHNIIDD